MSDLFANLEKAGLLYDDIGVMIDDVYSSYFIEDRPSDLYIKYEGAAKLVSDLELSSYLATHPEQPSDPRLRTHIYMNGIAQLVERTLKNEQPGTVLQLDRHQLWQYFPDHEFVGTPLSYTDLHFVKHKTGGIVLRHMGGGYAGSHLPEHSAGTALMNGITGYYEPDVLPDGTAKVPMKKLAGNFIKAAAAIGAVADEETDRLMSGLYVPHKKDPLDFITSRMVYKGVVLDSSVYLHLPLGIASMALGTYLEAHMKIGELEQVEAVNGKIMERIFTRHNHCVADAEGNVIYGASNVLSEEDMHESWAADYKRVQMRISDNTPVELLDTASNDRLAYGLAALTSPIL